MDARDNIGASALHIATRWDQKAIGLLTEAGADLNARDEDGATPLHWAVRRENPQAIRALLEAGADLDAQDEDGMTPLGVAESGRQTGRADDGVNPDVIAALSGAGTE